MKINSKLTLNQNIEDIPKDLLLEKEKVLDSEIKDEIDKVKVSSDYISNPKNLEISSQDLDIDNLLNIEDTGEDAIEFL